MVCESDVARKNAAEKLLEASARLGVVSEFGCDSVTSDETKKTREFASEAVSAFKGLKDDVGEADSMVVMLTAWWQESLDASAEEARVAATQLCMKGVEQRSDKRGIACMNLVTAEMIALSSKGGKDLEDALTRAEEACSSFSSLGDQAMEACAFLVLAVIYFKRNRASDTEDAARNALGLFVTLGDKAGQAKALHAKALAYVVAKDFQSAAKNAQKASLLYSEIGNSSGVRFEFIALARMQLLQGRPAAAMESAKRAYNIDHSNNSLSLMCEAAIASGNARQAVALAEKPPISASSYLLSIISQSMSSSPMQALTTAETALEFVKLQGNWQDELNVLYAKCQAELKLESFEAAATTMALAASTTYDSEEQAQALRMASFALAETPDISDEVLDRAIELATSARNKYKQAGLGSAAASTIMMITALKSKKLNDTSDLLPLTEEARQLFQNAGDVHGEIVSSGMLVDLYLARNSIADALSFASSNVDLCKQEGNKKAQAEAMYAFATLQMITQDLDEARNTILEGQCLCREVGARMLDAMFAILLVQVHVEELPSNDDPDARLETLKAAEAAVLLAKKAGDKTYYGVAMSWRAQILASAGRAAEALQAAQTSEKAFEQGKDVKNQVRSMVTVAELLRVLGKKAEATEAANAAIELANGRSDCTEAEEDARQVLSRMVEKRVRSAGGTRMVRKLVKKWRKKGSTGGGKGLDLAMVTPKITALVKDVLTEDEDLTLDSPFMEAGIDSLGSVQLLTDVGKAFSMALAPSAIFDYPSIRALSEFLVAEGGGATSASGGDEMEEYEDWEDVEEAIDGDYEESGPPQIVQSQSQGTQQAGAASIAAPAKKGLDLAMVTPKLLSLVKEVLVEDDGIELDSAFMEAGIDSLGSVQLLTDVGKTFQMSLAPSAIFDYPNVRALADFLVSESGG